MPQVLIHADALERTVTTTTTASSPLSRSRSAVSTASSKRDKDGEGEQQVPLSWWKGIMLASMEYFRQLSLSSDAMMAMDSAAITPLHPRFSTVH